jgi:hypothetical protein
MVLRFPRKVTLLKSDNFLKSEMKFKIMFFFTKAKKFSKSSIGENWALNLSSQISVNCFCQAKKVIKISKVSKTGFIIFCPFLSGEDRNISMSVLSAKLKILVLSYKSRTGQGQDRYCRPLVQTDMILTENRGLVKNVISVSKKRCFLCTFWNPFFNLSNTRHNMLFWITLDKKTANFCQNFIF